VEDADRGGGGPALRDADDALLRLLIASPEETFIVIRRNPTATAIIGIRHRIGREARAHQAALAV
jgi:hypothetical protein